MNSFKFSQNATFTDCTTATTEAVVEKMNIEPGMTDGEFLTALKKELNNYDPLYTKFTHSEEDEMAILDTFENLSLNSDSSERLQKSPAFRFVLQTLHDLEIVNEKAILSWAAKHEGALGMKANLFNQQPTQDFLAWLEESDDESDDESESSSDEDSE